MSDYGNEINHLHERISDNRDKLSVRVSDAEATANNTRGQIDLFKWVLTGLTIGFYGVCFWLVTETFSMKTAFTSLEYEVQGLKTEIRGLSASMERLESKLE